MSAASRLWRRAPLWRLSLGATLTFGALTALYPSPPLERALSFLTAATPSPNASTGVSVPSIIPTRHTLTAFAGRLLPLPLGDWHEILAGRFEPKAEVNEIVLARLRHGALTGLIDASATTGPSSARLGLPSACFDPTDYVADVSPARPAGDQCWFVRSAPGLSPLPAGARRTLLDGARDRLVRLGVAMQAAATRAVWFRTGNGEFMSVQIDLPSARPDRVEAWMKGWTVLLDHGFDGTLGQTDVTSRLARDPAARQ